jgi:hypothetical protein
MKVFISSTYVDLVDHRKAVAEALEHLGLQLTRMETFGARPEDPVRACLSEVTESELFVGIYARRYGYVPSNSTISITEAEFNHAVECRKPAFCFVVDAKYPWPSEWIEGEPGQSRLIAFRSRVEAAVVSDIFTTPDVLASRVATSVGRYLIASADVGRNNSLTTAQFVRLTISDAATMAFVDIMRLFCVSASKRARAVNESRYNEFVDIADQHLNELRIQVTRLAFDARSDIIPMCVDVERSLAWAFTRLRRGPTLDRHWFEYTADLLNAARRVDALANAAGGIHYASRAEEVEEIIKALFERHLGSSRMSDLADQFVQLRFEAQSAVLARMRRRKDFVIATIRDDIDKRLAVPYFTIDFMLLRNALKFLPPTAGGIDIDVL